MRRGRFAASVALVALIAASCNGKPDNTFGNNGSTTVGVEIYDKVYDVAIQPDGKIVAVGASSTQWDGSTGQMFSIVRLNPNGSPDTTFSGDGKVTVDFPQFDSERATSVVVLPDGRIVLGGQPAGDECTGGEGWLFAALNPNGSLDTDEGNQTPRNGTAVWHGSVFDEDIRLSGLSELVPDGDGFLIAGGNVVSRFGGAGFGVLFPDILFGGRVGEEEGFLRIDDEPNSTFGCHTVFDVSPNKQYIAGAGHIWNSSGISVAEPPGLGWFVSVDVQPDGKIVASGHMPIVGEPFIARFLPDGTADTSFLGTYGPLEDNGYQEGMASDFAFQRNGKILAFGASIIRLNPNGTLDTLFGNGGAAAVPGAGAGWVEGGFAVQSDGKLIGGGSKANDLNTDYWVGRFTP